MNEEKQLAARKIDKKQALDDKIKHLLRKYTSSTSTRGLKLFKQCGNMFNNCSTFSDVSDIIKKVASSEGQKALKNKLESQKRFQVLAQKKILKAKKIQRKKTIKKEELAKEIAEENRLKNKKPVLKFKLSSGQNMFASLVAKKKQDTICDDRKVLVHEFSPELKERYEKWKEVKS